MINKEEKINEAAARGEVVYKELIEMTKAPLKHNHDFLLRILSENAQTEFGKKYNFKKIKTIEEFKAYVPLTTYDDYIPYLEKMKYGEGNLLTQKDPSCYVQTSGSVGKPKLIPVSVEAVNGVMLGNFMNFYMQRQICKDTDKNTKSLFIVSYYDVEELPSEALWGDIAGMTINRFRDFFEIAYTTPACSVYANEFHDFFYVHARFALIERNLSSISAVFMTDIFELTNYIIKNQDILVNDIETGAIHEDVKIPESMRGKLAALINPDPVRASQLREIFSKGGSNEILKRLWPNLSLITAIGSATFWPYTQRVMEYAGKEVDFSHRVYAASEGQIGLVTEFNSTKYCLLPHQMFYEFIRLEDSEKDTPPRR